MRPVPCGVSESLATTAGKRIKSPAVAALRVTFECFAVKSRHFGPIMPFSETTDDATETSLFLQIALSSKPEILAMPY
jgi:hypothetical protein